MASFVIEGGHRLQGEIVPQGAKNEVLQVVCATLLTSEEVTIENIPDILDVNNLIQLLRDMGVKVSRTGVDTYTFRADEVDATHSPSFHQIEGMVIDKNITFADLKGTLQEFARELFGEDTKVKFRPHHFPFTEPSAEMDVTCFKCGGKGCRFCKGEGWIEILGCGMVHPKVLKMSGIDPEEYSGFAFGVGLERIALLKYEIDDMRLLYENDARFLKQF